MHSSHLVFHQRYKKLHNKLSLTEIITIQPTDILLICHELELWVIVVNNNQINNNQINNRVYINFPNYQYDLKTIINTIRNKGSLNITILTDPITNIKWSVN
jgi:hypothetical protein